MRKRRREARDPLAKYLAREALVVRLPLPLVNQPLREERRQLNDY